MASTTVILLGIIILGFILIASMVKVVPQRTVNNRRTTWQIPCNLTAGFQFLYLSLTRCVTGTH